MSCSWGLARSGKLHLTISVINGLFFPILCIACCYTSGITLLCRPFKPKNPRTNVYNLYNDVPVFKPLQQRESDILNSSKTGKYCLDKPWLKVNDLLQWKNRVMNPFYSLVQISQPLGP